MKRLLAVLVCIALLLTLHSSSAESYILPDKFTFSYPKGWNYNDTAYKHTSTDNTYWIFIAFDSETCLATEKTETRTKYKYMDLKDVPPEEMESIISDYQLYKQGGVYLETVYSDADGTPFLVYSYTNSAWTKEGEHQSIFYQGFTLLRGWTVCFSVYGNQKAEVRRDVNENDLQILRNALSSFRSLAAPLLRADGFYYSVNNNEAVIRGYFGTESDLVIPSEINGDPVTEIGDHAFAACSSLTSITIPASVSGIGDYAFGTCTNLMSITIPHGLIKIPDYAFYFCSNLKEVVLPETVKGIGVAAFSGCGSLESIAIPQGATTIGGEAFKSCRTLKDIRIPANIESIGTDAFEFCGSLPGISVDPANRKYESIEGILYDKSLKILLECPEGKTGKITLPARVTTINDKAFTYCKISEVILQYGVKRIEHQAFDMCSNLTAIEIPMSVTFINNDVFGGCSNLIIKGYEGQYAQKYAIQHKIPFTGIQKALALIIWSIGEPVGKEALMIDLASGIAVLALSAIAEPADARGTPLWSSSASTIVCVDESGLLTGLKAGAATITVTTADGSKTKASCKVIVTYLAKQIVITGKDTVASGKQIPLKAAVLPETTINKKVVWASSDTAIAAVSAGGVVTAKKVKEPKTVMIAATAKDGSGIVAEFTVTVTP